MRIYRNIGLLLFQFLIPTFQIVIFSLAIGHNLSGIRIAYANNDTGLVINHFPVPLVSVCNNTDFDHGFVNVSSFGELYVSKLLEDPTFEMVGLICHMTCAVSVT